MAMEESTLQISGMTCTACASRVEKGISKMAGVEKANVNFALEQLSVQYDSNETNVKEFKKEIEKIGYGVIEEKAEFDISGMTCAACATKIEKAIGKMDGVSSANVNFALETISVHYNDKEVQTSEMIAKVKNLDMSFGIKKMVRRKWIINKQRFADKLKKFVFLSY